MSDPDPDAAPAPDDATATDPNDATATDPNDATATDREATDPRTTMPDQRPDTDRQDSPSTDRPDADPEALFDQDVSAAAGDEYDDGVLPAAEDDTITKLYWVGLAGAVVFGAFALLRFYASVSTAIDVWVAAEYQPLLQASFNLVVVLGAGLVASVLLRRLSGSRS